MVFLVFLFFIFIFFGGGDCWILLMFYLSLTFFYICSLPSFKYNWNVYLFVDIEQHLRLICFWPVIANLFLINFTPILRKWIWTTSKNTLNLWLTSVWTLAYRDRWKHLEVSLLCFCLCLPLHQGGQEIHVINKQKVTAFEQVLDKASLFHSAGVHSFQ